MIETNRLLLLPYTSELITHQHVGWLNDKDVMRYSEQRHKTHTLSTQISYLEGMCLDTDLIWLIRTRANGQSKDIGTITAYLDRNNRIADMGILIGEKSLWSHGYGSEAWRAVMDWLHHEQHIRKIEAGCMQSNEAMKGICFNCRMVPEGLRPNHFLLDGKPEGLLLWGKTL